MVRHLPGWVAFLLFWGAVVYGGYGSGPAARLAAGAVLALLGAMGVIVVVATLQAARRDRPRGDAAARRVSSTCAWGSYVGEVDGLTEDTGGSRILAPRPVTLLAFRDVLLFVTLWDRRGDPELSPGTALRRHVERALGATVLSDGLSCDEVVRQLDDSLKVKAVPVAQVARAVCEPGEVGCGLSITGVHRLTGTYLVAEDATQPLASLLGSVLSDRFEDRHEPLRRAA